MDSPGIVNLDEVGAFEEDLFGNAISDSPLAAFAPTPTPSLSRAPSAPSPVAAAPLFAPVREEEGETKTKTTTTTEKKKKKREKKPTRLVRPGWKSGKVQRPGGMVKKKKKKKPQKQPSAPAPPPPAEDPSVWTLGDLMDGAPSPLTKTKRRPVEPLAIPRRDVPIEFPEPSPPVPVTFELGPDDSPFPSPAPTPAPPAPVACMESPLVAVDENVPPEEEEDMVEGEEEQEEEEEEDQQQQEKPQEMPPPPPKRQAPARKNKRAKAATKSKAKASRPVLGELPVDTPSNPSAAMTLFELKLARAMAQGEGMAGGSVLQETPDAKAAPKPGVYSPIKKYERRQLLPDEEYHSCSKRH